MLSETNKRYVSTALLLAFQATWLCEFQVSRGGRSEGFSVFRSALKDEWPIRDKDTDYLKTFLLLAEQTAFQILHTAPICRYSSFVKTAEYMKNCAYMLFFSQSLEWPAGHFSSSLKKTGIAYWNLKQPHMRNVWHECHISVCVCFILESVLDLTPSPPSAQLLSWTADWLHLLLAVRLPDSGQTQ